MYSFGHLWMLQLELICIFLPKVSIFIFMHYKV